ncbi:MAG TPA: DNA replication and repair protein RecF [Candidatus Andersenbacteria bacterium]|nr:DNA replication and repair protein RecF [Candidatus Andersenbacteria bacterium]
MDLRRLHIRHFRNFGRVEEIELPPRSLLVAAAANATGKTNFLESITVLLRGKSFRADIDACVGWGHDGFLLRGTLSSAAGEEHEVAVHYDRAGRKVRLEEDSVPASVVGFYARYPLVVFLPEDTFLFARGPAVRRSFLNHILVAHQPYVSALVQYHRVLRARNNLLKRARDAEALRSWTDLLADQAEVLWRHREGLATYFGDQLSGRYEQLAGEKLMLQVQLRRTDSSAAQLRERLYAAFADERRVGHTLYGPHRDDFLITVDEHPAHGALSRGQLRTLAAVLKILAHSYITQVTGEEPLLLLDDVLSEMDEKRQEALLSSLPTTQSLLTCTAVPRILQGKENVYLLDLRSIVARGEHVRRRVRTAVAAAPERAYA